MTSPAGVAAGARPYPWFLPQSVKVYPLHQLLPETPAPRAATWNPVMAREVAEYLAGCGPGATVGRQLYLHIPFCPAFCHFCCLYKTMEPDQQGADFIATFVDGLIEEIRMYARLPVGQSRPLSSVYFGGGTPSMLTAAQFHRIISEITRSFPLAPSLEITFEGMAHQLKDREYLRALRDGGVTRISYGVQTFQPELRKQLGRLDTGGGHRRGGGVDPRHSRDRLAQLRAAHGGARAEHAGAARRSGAVGERGPPDARRAVLQRDPRHEVLQPDPRWSPPSHKPPATSSCACACSASSSSNATGITTPPARSSIRCPSVSTASTPLTTVAPPASMRCSRSGRRRMASSTGWSTPTSRR